MRSHAPLGSSTGILPTVVHAVSLSLSLSPPSLHWLSRVLHYQGWYDGDHVRARLCAVFVGLWISRGTHTFVMPTLFQHCPGFPPSLLCACICSLHTALPHVLCNVSTRCLPRALGCHGFIDAVCELCVLCVCVCVCVCVVTIRTCGRRRSFLPLPYLLQQRATLPSVARQRSP